MSESPSSPFTNPYKGVAKDYYLNVSDSYDLYAAASVGFQSTLLNYTLDLMGDFVTVYADTCAQADGTACSAEPYLANDYFSAACIVES